LHARVSVTGINVMGMRWPDLVSNDTIGIFAGVTGEDRAYRRARGP
jgi:hypothetical protein